jgi:tetratricopeptide (TPR) repeat protein
LKSFAIIAYKEKNYVEARNRYQQLLEIDPGNAEFKQALQDLNKAIAAQK